MQIADNAKGTKYVRLLYDKRDPIMNFGLQNM